jgi:hypothetical protein
MMLTSSMDALSFSLCFDTTSMAHRDAVRVRAASTPSPPDKLLMLNNFSLNAQISRAKSMPPETHGLADVDAPLVQQIVDVPQRQREADIHHHRQANGRGVTS